MRATAGGDGVEEEAVERREGRDETGRDGLQLHSRIAHKAGNVTPTTERFIRGRWLMAVGRVLLITRSTAPLVIERRADIE